MDNQQLELPNGAKLCGGRYTITAKLGGGGFGITYKAQHSSLGYDLCIKEFFMEGRCMRHSDTLRVTTISREYADVVNKCRRAFVDEAKVLSGLQHSGVVKVIDIFDENDTSYIVMEYIKGENLQTIVDRQGPIPYADAVNYIAQVADTLDYIHRHHLLHRDIKPENIMITPDFKAVLIDFGSARLFEEDRTQHHTVLLTRGYAPPEQYSEISHKGSYTDIYALGATLYFILTGVVPIEATLRLIETLAEPKSINAAIPDEANATIVKAMQVQASDRYQSVQEFMKDLRNTHNKKIDETNKEVSINPQDKAPSWATRFILFALAAILFLLLVVGATN